MVKIRNGLIHQGSLKGSQFPDQQAASVPIAEALSWFDSYVYAILGLAAPATKRHKAADLENFVNSFSF